MPAEWSSQRDYDTSFAAALLGTRAMIQVMLNIVRNAGRRIRPGLPSCCDTHRAPGHADKENATVWRGDVGANTGQRHRVCPETSARQDFLPVGRTPEGHGWLLLTITARRGVLYQRDLARDAVWRRRWCPGPASLRRIAHDVWHHLNQLLLVTEQRRQMCRSARLIDQFRRISASTRLRTRSSTSWMLERTENKARVAA